MIVDEIFEKVKLLKVYDYRLSLINKPKLTDLFLEVTSRCNARCEHCGSSCGEKIPKDEIEYDYLIKVLDEIDKKYGAKNVFLNVTGGEPLLRKDLFDLMKHAVSLGYYWGITTNGMLIDEEMVKKIIDANMWSVSVSIDGLRDTHDKFRKVNGGFDKLIKGIKLMQKTGKIGIIQVTTVANKKNINELEDLYELMKDLGIKYWRVVNCDPIGRAKKNDDILLDGKDYAYLFKFIREKQAEGLMEVSYGCSHYVGANLEEKLRRGPFVCRAGINVGSVLSNGDICACPNIERRKELIQGNIRKDSFVDVWENRYENFRVKRVTTNKKCQKCSEWKFCAGDAFHTWNFDDNVPNICLKKMIKNKEKYEIDPCLSYDENFYRACIEAAKEYKVDKELMTTIFAEAHKKLEEKHINTKREF